MKIGRRTILGLSGIGASAALIQLYGRRSWTMSPTSVGAAAEVSSSLKIPIGMNLAEVADYEVGFPFKNLFWGARPWMTQSVDSGGQWDTGKISEFEFDEDGYPLEVPISVSAKLLPHIPFTLIPNVRPSGRYVVLFDGEGEFGGKMGTSIVSSNPGRVVIKMTNRAGLVEGLALKRSRRGNHVRNIRVLALEHENADLVTNPFLDEFLDFCRPFHCIRFMEWAKTNGSLEEEWQERKRATFYTMVGTSGDVDGLFGPKIDAFSRKFSGGVAIELMIQLANKLMIDPWFCIPHRATEEYIREYAKLVRSKLDPRLKIYLEYSNEVWNFGFLQSSFMLSSQLAGNLVERGGGKAWENAEKTKGSNHPERIAALFRRTFDIWETEWSGKDRSRLVRVCAVQAGWLDAAKRTVKWCGENGGADAVSPTAYFGPWDKHYERWAAKGAALTADEVIADMREVVLRQGQGNALTELASYAKSFGMNYISYEGGQHIQPKNHNVVPYNHALGAAQSHPEMYDLYVENLRQQQRYGSKLMCAFTSVGAQGSRWGSWGHKASYDEPLSRAPKMRALLDCNVVKPSI